MSFSIKCKKLEILFTKHVRHRTIFTSLHFFGMRMAHERKWLVPPSLMETTCGWIAGKNAVPLPPCIPVSKNNIRKQIKDTLEGNNKKKLPNIPPMFR